MPAETKAFMLTTTDNPWNPWTHWEEWYAYDQSKGYDTPGFLARVVRTSFDLSDADQDLALTEALEEIIQNNVLGIYRKISEDDVIGAA